MSLLDHYSELYYQSQNSDGTDQFTHFLPTARDEMLEDMGAIAKLELNKIIPT